MHSTVHTFISLHNRRKRSGSRSFTSWPCMRILSHPQGSIYGSQVQARENVALHIQSDATLTSAGLWSKLCSRTSKAEQLPSIYTISTGPTYCCIVSFKAPDPLCWRCWQSTPTNCCVFACLVHIIGILSPCSPSSLHWRWTTLTEKTLDWLKAEVLVDT